jgi:chitinase
MAWDFFQDYAIKYWLKKGAPSDKLVMGVPFYGRSYTLKDPSMSTPGSAIMGPGKEGKYTQVIFVAYAQNDFH